MYKIKRRTEYAGTVIYTEDINNFFDSSIHVIFRIKDSKFSMLMFHLNKQMWLSIQEAIVCSISNFEMFICSRKEFFNRVRDDK